jgi:hypothetical protein
MVGEIVKILEHLSRRGVDLTEEQLEEAIMKFALEKEDESAKNTKRKTIRRDA